MWSVDSMGKFVMPPSTAERSSCVMTSVTRRIFDWVFVTSSCSRFTLSDCTMPPLVSRSTTARMPRATSISTRVSPADPRCRNTVVRVWVMEPPA